MSERSAAVAGSGAREHVLAQLLVEDGEYEKVYVLGGNAGTEMMPGVENIVVGGVEDTARFIKEREIDFTIVGPEQLLIDGLADAIRANGQTVFGPSAKAARLEASKAFSTRFMQEKGIPTPESWIFTNMDEALDWAKKADPLSYVIKADGNAAGKGVILPATTEEALRTIGGMMSGEMFDEAGKTIVIQERLTGPEVSVFVVSDGHNISFLPVSQDHKRLLNGDEGPNTGGMGAYAPVPEAIMKPWQWEEAKMIAEMTIQGMERKGTPFQGILFMGLILAEQRGDSPVVIEYNVRFGDPEAQAVLPVAQSQIKQPRLPVNTMTNLFRTAAEGQLINVPFRPSLGKSALTVCLAGEGYPYPGSKYAIPREVHGLDRDYKDAIVYHAATSLDKRGRVVTRGGRILTVTGLGDTLDEAAKNAYAAFGPDAIHTEGGQYRTDIGYQARKPQA